MVYITSFTLTAVLVGSMLTLLLVVVYITSFTLTAVLVGSMLTLAVSNGIYNKFHFDSCSCQLYNNLSC